MLRSMRLVQLFGPDPTRLQPIGIRYGDTLYVANIAASSMDDALNVTRAILDEAGIGLDGLARATAFVRTPAEREPVYGPWDALFPDPANRPAFKVLVAPLPAGTAIQMNLLALAGGTRERIDIEGVSARDPSVKVGGWTLTSRVHGTDPATGGVAAGGLDAEARQAVANIATLTGSAEISHLAGFVREPAAAEALRRAADTHSRMPAPGVLTNFVPPSMNLMLEAIAGRPAVREIYTAPTSGPFPDAVMIDNLFFAPSLGPGTGDDFTSQLRSALQRLDDTLAAAGLTRDAVAHVSVYFPSMDLKPLLNDVWSEWFPNPHDRPPHIYVPDTLPPGRQVQLQVFAVRDAQPRQILEIPGIQHGDPMSMGVRSAEQVFSSRVFGTDPATGKTPSDPESLAAVVFANVCTLLAQAGGAPDALSQVNAFVGTHRDRAAALAAFDELFAQTPAGSRPVLRFLSANLTGGSSVRVEIMASVPRPSGG
jgi:2-iminobutanoate/2-iminopropanoate deaminase